MPTCSPTAEFVCWLLCRGGITHGCHISLLFCTGTAELAKLAAAPSPEISMRARHPPAALPASCSGCTSHQPKPPRLSLWSSAAEQQIHGPRQTPTASESLGRGCSVCLGGGRVFPAAPPLLSFYHPGGRDCPAAHPLLLLKGTKHRLRSQPP